MSNSVAAAMIDLLFYPHLHRHHHQHQSPPSPTSSAPPPSTATTTSSTAPPPTIATCRQAGSLHPPRRLQPSPRERRLPPPLSAGFARSLLPLPSAASPPRLLLES
ncbi:unnamed protein product [Linum trigynum]|uniref:Uncharacterized protein n=1 Tax=Linum trigynum TaxID=586398 RepID=A0AAV2DG96_9ROSI